MIKIWAMFVTVLGLALSTLFFVNKLHNNGKEAGISQTKLENIVVVNQATQSEIDDIMSIYQNDTNRIKTNDEIKAPNVTSCNVTVEWLRKLETLK